MRTPLFVFVTLAKYAISLRSPVHGRVPARPMPMSRVAARISVISILSLSFFPSISVCRVV